MLQDFLGENAKRRLAMLKAYVASTEVGTALILAGYIATAEKWAAFSDEWEALLKAAEIGSFEMPALGTGMETAAAFYRIIEDHASAGITCVVPVEPLRKVVNELKLSPVFANSYYLASNAIINLTARRQEEMGLTEPIDFIFDEQAERNRMRAAWDGYLEGLPPEVCKLVGGGPSLKSDTNALPLQAAELFAWWARQYWVTHGTISPGGNIEFPWTEEHGTISPGGNIEFPWTEEHTLPWLAVEYDENGLRNELAKVRRAQHGDFPTAVTAFNVTFAGKDLPD